MCHGHAFMRSQVPSACARGDDAEQAPEDAVDAAGPRLDARVAVRVDGDGEARAVGGRVEGGRGGGVERVAVVGEQQGAQRLADRDRAREILVVERLAGLGEPVLGEPLRQRRGNGKRVRRRLRDPTVLTKSSITASSFGAGVDITTKTV